MTLQALLMPQAAVMACTTSRLWVNLGSKLRIWRRSMASWSQTWKNMKLRYMNLSSKCRSFKESSKRRTASVTTLRRGWSKWHHDCLYPSKSLKMLVHSRPWLKPFKAKTSTLSKHVLGHSMNRQESLTCRPRTCSTTFSWSLPSYQR